MKTNKFQNKYRIPSARADWHDYNGGEYFITICTKNRRHYFGEIRDNEMLLSEVGRYMVECIENVPGHFLFAQIPLFVVMPNHLHLIVIIHMDAKMPDADFKDAGDVLNDVSTTTEQGLKNEKLQTTANKCGYLSHMISNMKASVMRFSNLNQIEFGWQPRFHDHLVRSQDEMNRIATYIENNILTWKDDKFYNE